ncbi:MAG: conjugal transfer protein TrbF [Synergistaceae bacterium]|nr:conjugal transfer protein TrbF [Synergistaceae bacterium]MBQ9404787.1 conjugal transfer protein TrbF [Synergistaceae bacterium]MBQ9595101.1 conjugal transfer protein TrbF [Synergistaceae bacterium]
MFWGKNKKKEEEERVKKQLDNPYISARAEYGDRYGAAANEAARWRQISFLMLMLCALFGFLMIWMASQNKVVPYVVQVDKQGYTVAIRPAEESSNADNRVIIAALGRFITNFKTAVLDPYAQRYLIDQVYNYIGSGSQAESVVNNFYRENNPFAEGRDYTRSVEIHSILPIGGGNNSWQILWLENMVRNGEIQGSTEWRAIMSIKISPVRELSAVIKNPVGIYVTELNMAQDIIQDDQNN